MKAIYIGFSKCGTKTMGAVFRGLGYNTYDSPESFSELEKDWTKIFNEGATVNDFKRMFKDVDATVDLPAYIFWEEILEAFPDVKLLVFYRDEESWMRSFINQAKVVLKDRKFQITTMLSPTAQRYVAYCRLTGGHVWGADRQAWPWQFLTGINYTLLRQRYRKHNLYIQKKAPKDQLHVVDFKKGWNPICKFLGEPIPDAPFPHANKAGQILKEYMDTHPLFVKIKQECCITLALLFIAFALIIILFSC